jgi:hypothetical protein
MRMIDAFSTSRCARLRAERSHVRAFDPTAFARVARNCLARLADSAVVSCALALTLMFCFAGSACAQSPDLDKYGGAKSLKCSKATGWFYTEEIGGHWWFCTPVGNAFYSVGIEQAIANQDDTIQAAVKAKYGSTSAWVIATNQRLQSWGFNTFSTGAYLGAWPVATDFEFPADSSGVHSPPIKLPFIAEVRPAIYAMKNQPQGSGGPYLSEPVKNMLYVHSSYYTGYAPGVGVADYYDSGIQTWLHDELTRGDDYQWNIVKGSPYQNYMLGIASDDGDEMYGFTAGPDFPTTPPGHNNSNLAMIVATMSPVETANPDYGFVYGDALIHSKKALRDFLADKYGSIAALNAAWGSSYTTFDSSGSAIAGEVVAIGDGATLTYTHEFAHPAASKFSVEIFADGKAVAGETDNGDLWGPDVTGRAGDRTGVLMLAFRPGHAPAANARITVNYIQNGWGIGSGLMDEDDRPSHRGWMGDDWFAMSDANPHVKADLNEFLGRMAAQYLSLCRTEIKAAYPNALFLGPDSLSNWGAPPPASVLRAAAQYVDAFITSSDTVFTTAELDFIEQNFGNKPYFGSFYSSANSDSALSAYPNNDAPIGFDSQDARGNGYYKMMAGQLQSAHTTSGNYPYVGVAFWELYDNWGEKLNWGIVTHNDNAYDGHEAVAGSVSCSAPLSRFRCGGEARNYGDFVSWMKKANQLWLGAAKK